MNVLYNLNIITYVDKILRLQSLIMYLILQTIQLDIHSSQSCTNCFFKRNHLKKLDGKIFKLGMTFHPKFP